MTTNLTQWRVYSVPVPGSIKVTTHLVGYDGYAGRVSSPIITLDTERMEATTGAGQVYRLSGTSGFNRDACYTFNAWCDIKDVKDFEDVTRDYE